MQLRGTKRRYGNAVIEDFNRVVEIPPWLMRKYTKTNFIITWYISNWKYANLFCSIKKSIKTHVFLMLYSFFLNICWGMWNDCGLLPFDEFLVYLTKEYIAIRFFMFERWFLFCFFADIPTAKLILLPTFLLTISRSLHQWWNAAGIWRCTVFI